ncbi:hypothetical protein PGT21_018619 [Puccinia graminis f. sp. tritici]|uniref:TNFR-Cys domain-containing protein n=1 Tax=Puccinia graminis f. sp. tritici TaxID=56615 RepID=A0A5B0NPX4_PUCGR|nr:hypothetical protein PGT21_018619 [Puccinia graminis f. sp. tritici]KAA1125517.1 hypothetical protein PGTUg99_012325 [Puccinia graminis f. sp. tritici]
MLLQKINVLVLLLSCLTSAHGYDPPLCPKCNKDNSSYLPRNYDMRRCNTVTKCNHHGDCLPCTEMVPYQVRYCFNCSGHQWEEVLTAWCPRNEYGKDQHINSICPQRPPSA